MADQNNVQVEQFVEAPNVQQLVEAQNSSGKKMLAQVTGIYTKCGYIEQRLERLQKRRVDQFRHLVQHMGDFDDNLGGQYGFLTSIKEVLDHCPFKKDSDDERVFLWAAGLKARSEALYAKFEIERKLIQAKSLQSRIDEFKDIESSVDYKGDLERNIKWLEESLTDAQAALQVALRNRFRPEFLSLLGDLDITALETKLASDYSKPLKLQQIADIKWYALEAYARMLNMFEQAQALVDEKHIVEGKLVGPDQVLKIFEEKLNEPLEPLRPFPRPNVEIVLDGPFKDAFQRVVSKNDIQVTEKKD